MFCVMDLFFGDPTNSTDVVTYLVHSVKKQALAVIVKKYLNITFNAIANFLCLLPLAKLPVMNELIIVYS